MANRKITSLVALAAPATDDVLPIIDISETGNDLKNKKITYGELFKSLPDGTASAPSVAFNSATSTGLYRSAANELSIATNGGQAIKVESDNKTTIYGDLVVTGSQTTVSSTTITVADKNIELGTGNSSDSGADGGGLTLKGASDKTWNWVDSTDAWTANQHIDVTTGKVFKIAGTQVLSATTLGAGIVNSSLTSVGTLGSLTVTNAVTAGSLDISGGADIDGTLEADAYTVNGTALNEYIADTVGAMVSSNTETNITVTYQDADNTLDFVIGTLNQDTTGNAATATALETARTIGGVSFNGTANINLPGVNQTGNQNTTGSAATLTTARTIGGVSFDGSANINLPGVNAAGNQNTSGTAAGLSGTPNITVGVVTGGSLDISGSADIDGTLEADAYTVNGTALNEYIADTVGAMVSSNTETNIAVTYNDSDNTLDFSVVNITGNAATATALQTARTINGVSFDGTGNITVTSAAGTLSGTTLNSSVVTSSLTSVGTLGSLAVTNAITAGSLDISGGVDVDGTLEADAITVDGTALNEFIADTVGAMVSSNTESDIVVTYQDSDNTLDFTVSNISGNAGTATALQNARTIGGVSFDGTANITLPGVNATGNQNTTGSAATLTTARTIGGVSFNGSANIDLPGVNTAGNQNTTGNAATATALQTARTIGGTSFDGTANITPANATTAVNVTGTVGSSTTGTTQSAGDNSTKIATTAFVETAISNLIDSSPGALNTLNELAAAIGDDANFSTTITNSIATKLSLAGGTMTGAIDLGSNNITNGGTITGTFVGNVTGNITGNTSGSSGSCTGNAATATKLATARTIGGTSFDGSANIAVALAATATALATARTIGGVSFDGTGNINLPGVNAAGNQNTSGTSAGLTGTPNITVGVVTAGSLDISGNVDVDGTLETDALTIDGVSLSETIADTVGAMVGSNTETGITVTYDDSDNTLDFVVGTLNQSTTGNAATATALATARTINGVSFDGTGNITVTAAAGTLTGSTLASGVTASSLTSVGTLTGLTVSGNISMTGTGAIDVPTGTTGQRPGSPTTGLFRYNSTEGEFEGYTASGWGAIAGGGGASDFKYLALRNSSNNGAASYPASDFTLVTSGTTNAITPTAANVLLVSVGGVIQQPNTGTSTPSTGFAISGSTIKFGSNISAAPDFIIYQQGGGIGTPSDNTVTSDKIVNGAIVNIDINASAAIAGTKISPDFGSQNVVTTGTLSCGDITSSDGNGDLTLKDSNHTGSYAEHLIKFTGNDNAVLMNFGTPFGSNDLFIKYGSTQLVKVSSAGNVDVAAGVDVTGNITVTGTVDGVDIAALNTNVGTKLPLAGGTLTGNLIVEDSVLRVGDISNDNYTEIKHLTSDSYGFDYQHDNASAILNEQGTTNQALVLGDVNADGSSVLLGVSVKQVGVASDAYVPKFTLTGAGALTLTSTCTATAFSGSGASLTNLPDKDQIKEGNSYAEILDTGSNGIFRFLPEGNEVFRIATDGKVGIGIVAPTESLDVNGNFRIGDGNAGRHITFSRSGLGNALWFAVDGHEWSSNNVATISSGTTQPLVLGANDAERLRIASDGAIGINQTNPNKAKLHVVADTGSTDKIVAKFRNPNGSASVKAKIGLVAGYSDTANDTEGQAYIGAQREGSGNNSALFFETSDGSNLTERLRIRSDGHFILETTNNGYGGLKIYEDSAGDYNVRYVAGRNQSATSHVFMRSGRTQNQSPWADATPAEHARITRGGIAFGGETAAVNTLDAYEEGTHNPTDKSNSSLSFTINHAGKYTRIGNLVHVHFDITFPSTSNNSVARVSTPFNQGSQYSGGIINWTDLGRPCCLHVGSSANGVYLMDMDTTGAGKHLTNSQCSGKRFIGNYTYNV